MGKARAHEQLNPWLVTPRRKWGKGNTKAPLAFFLFSFLFCDFDLWGGVIRICNRSSLLRHIQRCISLMSQAHLTLKYISKIKHHTMSLHKGIETPGRKCVSSERRPNPRAPRPRCACMWHQPVLEGKSYVQGQIPESSSKSTLKVTALGIQTLTQNMGLNDLWIWGDFTCVLLNWFPREILSELE